MNPADISDWNAKCLEGRSAPLAVGPIKRFASGVLGWIAAFLGLLASGRRRRNRLIVLEPFGLGDVISLEPLVASLAGAGWPTVCCIKPQWRQVLSDHPGIRILDAKLPWSQYAAGAKYGFRRYLSREFFLWACEFRAECLGGIGIDTRGDVRSCLALYLGGCGMVLTRGNYIGYDLAMGKGVGEQCRSGDWGPRWLLNLEVGELLLGHECSAVRRPRVPRPLGVDGSGGGRRVACVPVAPWPGKAWSPARWQALVGRLRERGWGAVGYCGPGQHSEAARYLGEGTPVVECGSVERWASELVGCSAVISVDSGPLHLADGLDLPVVGLYGTGALPLWGPSGPRSVTVHHHDDAAYRPIHPIWINIAAGQALMERISVDEVWDAFNRLMTVEDRKR